MCKGYVIWPEASHTDIFAWRYFTDNCWKLSDKSTDMLLSDFCKERYGAQEDCFLRVWRMVVEFSSRCGWGRSFPDAFDSAYAKGRNDPRVWSDSSRMTGSIPAREIFKLLADIRWEGEFVRRDAVDLARTTLDRLIYDGFWDMMRTWHEVKSGRMTRKELFVANAERVSSLVWCMADLLALHEDFSLSETLDGMNAVEKVRNPGAEHLLFENAACDYCRSHHAEWARGWYAPLVREIVQTLTARVNAGDFSPLPPPSDYRAKLRARAHPIRDFAPDPSMRTPANWRRVLLDCAKAVQSDGHGNVSLHLRN